MRVGLTYWRQHDRPAAGRRYLAARPSAKATPAPSPAGARGSSANSAGSACRRQRTGVLRIRPCICRRRRPHAWCGWGHPRWLPPARQSPLAYPRVGLVFPQLCAAPFHQEPAAPAGCLCPCITAGLKNRSALRSVIEGAHCLYYNFKSNLKQ